MNIKDNKKSELRMDNKGSYIELTKKNFRQEVLGGGKPILVEFRANWSGTCDIMSPIMEELSVLYAGRLAIGLIDTDKNGDLVEEYGVNHLPTFIFFKKGQVVDHIVGAVPKPVMTEKIEKIINNNGDLEH